MHFFLFAIVGWIGAALVAALLMGRFIAVGSGKSDTVLHMQASNSGATHLRVGHDANAALRKRDAA